MITEEEYDIVAEAKEEKEEVDERYKIAKKPMSKDQIIE